MQGDSNATGWVPAIGAVTGFVDQAGVGAASEGSTLTPAGTFSLTQAFGRHINPGTALPYFRTDTLDWWDENPASPTYKLHVRQTASPGAASENLYYSGAVYECAVVIGYNSARVPGRRSSCTSATGGQPRVVSLCRSPSKSQSCADWYPGAAPVISIGVG